NRQRFPKENAAIAAFAVERVETVEHAHDEHDEDHHHRRRVVRRFNGDPLLHWVVEQQQRAPALRQADRADGKSKDLNRGDDQRCEIDRAVLPQFSPHRPVERPGRRNCGSSRRLVRRFGDARCGIHFATAASVLCPVSSVLCPWLMTATNKSAMLGVRASPSAASWPRSTFSNNMTLRPNTCRSCSGLSERAPATWSGCTITSTYRD